MRQGNRFGVIVLVLRSNISTPKGTTAPSIRRWDLFSEFRQLPVWTPHCIQQFLLLGFSFPFFFLGGGGGLGRIG